MIGVETNAEGRDLNPSCAGAVVGDSAGDGADNDVEGASASGNRWKWAVSTSAEGLGDDVPAALFFSGRSRGW